MSAAKRSLCLTSVLLVFFGLLLARPSEGQTGQPGQVARSVGTVKAISGSTVTLTPDSGSETSVLVQDSTRLLRIPPGETTLKNATPVHLQDLQPGDRILVGGKLADDSKSIDALTIVVMKRSDVAAKQEADREDWQKHGIAGLVRGVDPAQGTITISRPSPGRNKAVTIQTDKSTVIRRYAPDSMKFEDAEMGTLAEIKPGDQLRARGSQSADGSELTAIEIVSGTFRNIAGTVISADASANTLTILDLTTKKPLQVKITQESQLRKVPPAMAEHMAMRMKSVTVSAHPAPAGTEADSTALPSSGQSGEPPHPSGFPDLGQMLARMPTIGIGDLKKGDAVMLVSTEGTPTGGVTAITLLAGVEPILQASPKGQPMNLSPWNLGGGGGGEDAEQ